MARSRNIKPSIMDNDQLAELPPLTRLLFIYLWMLADRAGRLEDRPKRIAAQALPFDRDADADSMLAELEAAGFILRYKAGGCAYIQIVNFARHQAPHVREAQSTIPAPNGSVPSTGAEQDSNGAKHGQGSAEASPRHDQGSDEASPRSPDSLIPDSLIQEPPLTPPAGGEPMGDEDPKPEDPQPPAPRKRERKPAIEFQTFLAQCRERGESAIAGYEPMVRYVEEAKLPMEFAQLCWDEFKRRHLQGGGRETKRQADWRRTFYNYLQGNWFHLWWSPEPGRYELTSAGLQAKTVLDARRTASERAAA